MATPFEYAADPAPYRTLDSRIFCIPGNASDEQEFLRALAVQLRFPEYFGENWNALVDCLRDFHWIPEHRIVLWHPILPPLSEGDLAVYLDVLGHSVRDWYPGEAHELVAVFQPEARSRVDQLYYSNHTRS